MVTVGKPDGGVSAFPTGWSAGCCRTLTFCEGLFVLDGENEVITELCLDDIAHFVGPQCEGGTGEGLNHTAAAGEPANVALVLLAGAVRFLGRRLGEHPFEHLGSFPLSRRLAKLREFLL